MNLRSTLRIGRRRVLTLSPYAASQLVSSSSNLLGAIVGARILGLEGFAAYSFALTTTALVQSLGRAAVGEPLLIFASGLRQAPERNALFRAALRRSTKGGVVVGALVAAVSLLPGGLTTAMWAAGLSTPFLVWHDLLRYLAYAERRPIHAATLDLVWLASQGVATLLLYHYVDDPGPGIVLLAWTSGAAVGTLFGMPSMLRREASGGASRNDQWSATELTASRNLTGQAFFQFITAQATNLIVAGIAGASVLGAIRGLQTLLSPLGALTSLAIPILVPRQRAAWLAGDVDDLKRKTRAASLWLSFVIGGGVAVLGIAFEPLISATLGSEFSSFRTAGIIVAMSALPRVAVVPCSAALRAMDETGRLLRGRFGAAGLGVVAVTLTSITQELEMVAIGVTLQAIATYVILQRNYRCALGELTVARKVVPDA